MSVLQNKSNPIADILGLTVMIILGTIATTWLFSLPIDQRNNVLGLCVNLLTFLLAQPGIFIGARIASNSNISVPKRIVKSLLVLLILGIAIPMIVSALITPLIKF